ncbi:DUF6488 family protein [uncultured Roseibium sp.]|uniref:DUF6488 family protein n=1 Tax=uncultured Roseibium sp. TaxID=1936171 RepID=UPI003217DC9C
MLKIIALVAALFLGTASAYAHSGGHGFLTEEDARITASNAAGYFVTHDVGKQWGMLPQSWSVIPFDQTKILAVVDGDFVIAVMNLEEKKTLYVLVAGSGDVLDANFEGIFPFVYDAKKEGTLVTLD